MSSWLVPIVLAWFGVATTAGGFVYAACAWSGLIRYPTKASLPKFPKMSQANRDVGQMMAVNAAALFFVCFSNALVVTFRLYRLELLIAAFIPAMLGIVLLVLNMILIIRFRKRHRRGLLKHSDYQPITDAPLLNR